jgi:hypothetical protein
MRGIRSLATTLALVAGTLVVAAPAAADSPTGGYGQVGVHALVDTDEYPGARCVYDNSSALGAVVVRAPVVYARNRSAGRDRQRVAWQILLQRRMGSSDGFEVVARSAIQSAPAWDDRSAAFQRMRLGYDGSASEEYRVIVRMVWYVPGSDTIAGVHRHAVDLYRLPADPAHPGSCPGGVF